MDPFTPIRVDPEPEESAESQKQQTPTPAAGKPDAADVAFGLAQNLYLLGVIEHQMDATVSGAADVTGDAGQPVATRGEPLDAPDRDHGSTGGDGCLAGLFALLLMLTLAAGTTFALTR